MKGFARIFLAVFSIFTVLSFLPVSGTDATGSKTTTFGLAAKSASGDNPCYRWKRKERGFARKTNAARTNAGLQKLKLDPELSKAAKKHTFEMASRNVLAHTESTDLRRRVTNWTILGENVGVGGTVGSLQTAFMNSPAHKDNIMLPGFTNFGVGTVNKDGRLWVTVIFESVSNPGTPLNMPNC
jgi:uncharacterized protein YkwD